MPRPNSRNPDRAMRQAGARPRNDMRSRNRMRSQTGMSLVELMVAAVISLLGVLVIFQVFAVNEGVRRSTTAGSDEQTSGLLALLLIERELRHAGFGINDFGALGCNMKMWDANRTPQDVPDFPLSAVEIVSNAGTAPDVLRVTYGGSVQSTVAVKLGVEMADPTAPLQLEYRFGFTPADVIVISAAGLDCTLREVTGIPGLIQIEHQPGAYINAYTGDSQVPRFNKPAGTPATYMTAAKVQNLGPFPVRNELTVRNGEVDPAQNNQLVVSNLFGQSAQIVPVAEQIVHLKAEYGMDDGNNNGSIARASYVADDNIVDNYTGVSPAGAAGWQRVRSVRIAIVSRSRVAERPTSGDTCDATADWGSAQYPVRWARGLDTPEGRPIDVRTVPNWRCFKYKVYETTVPLRNMLWRQA